MAGPGPARAVADALEALGVRNLLLSVHDGSFPGDPDEDVGRGSPYSRGGGRFLAWARALGFNGILFGPQGQTGEGNASPYDGTVFARNPLSIALGPLARDPHFAELLTEGDLAEFADERPAAGAFRVPYRAVYALQRRALIRAFGRYDRLPDAHPMHAAFARFRQQNAAWIETELLYELVSGLHGEGDFRRWDTTPEGRLDARLWDPEPGRETERAVRHRFLSHGLEGQLEVFAFWQYLAHAQHALLREHAGALGLRLYGDLQIGLSLADEWAQQAILLRGYRMGAPPSRTNPEGQDWNYALLDPAGYGTRERPGPALAFAAARMNKLLSEFDGVRVDHPHGLVCPWVYRREGVPDPLESVRAGARLFESPDLPDHPDLAPYAITRRDQLNPDPRTARYAEDWVVDLEPAQVERYSVLVDTIVAAAGAHGRRHEDLLFEVLSTLPYPLRRVMERHDLGRFRVTQKADPNDPRDVYRTENAAENDWVMVGNHDTPSAWSLPARWTRAGTLADQARYLAARMAPAGGARRRALEREFLRDPGALLHAKFADLFTCPARNVLVFFTDLLGMRDPYNTPGTVSDDNWSLRVPPDYAGLYRARVAAGEALDLPRALAMALRARGSESERAHEGLIAALGPHPPG